MRYTYLVVISIFLLSTCLTKSSKPTFDADLQDIIYTCITNAVGHSDSARYFGKLMPPDLGYGYFTQPEKYNDSIKKMVDTAAMYFVVKQQLGHIYNEDIEELAQFINLENGKSNGNNKEDLIPDSSYIGLIDLKTLQEKMGIPVSEKEKGINDRVRMIGSFSFSKPAFHLSKNKCVILFDLYVAPKFGRGEIFLLQKESGKWNVIKSDRTWVS